MSGPRIRQTTPRRSAGLRVTRRQLLIGLGGAAAAGAACAVTGVGGLVMLNLLTKNPSPTLPTQSQIPTATASPIPPTPIPPAIISREEWGGLPPNHEAGNETGFYSADNTEGWYTYSMPIADAYQTLVLHHSVVTSSNDVASMRSIQTLHRTDRAWADIGYHFLVGREGGIYEARPLNVRGIHVAGHNTGSAGVCLIGNFVNDSLNEEQRTSTMTLLKWLTEILPNVTHLAGHNEFNPETLCPGDHLHDFLDEAAESLGLQRGVGGYKPPAEATALPPT